MHSPIQVDRVRTLSGSFMRGIGTEHDVCGLEGPPPRQVLESDQADVQRASLLLLGPASVHIPGCYPRADRYLPPRKLVIGGQTELLGGQAPYYRPKTKPSPQTTPRPHCITHRRIARYPPPRATCCQSTQLMAIRLGPVTLHSPTYGSLRPTGVPCRCPPPPHRLLRLRDHRHPAGPAPGPAWDA